MGLADLAVWQWTLFAFVVLFFGVAKGGFGAGIGFLATGLTFKRLAQLC